MDATQLKRIPVFADVPEEDLTVITTFATSDEVPEGAVIVKEGDYANAFMAIEEGTAKVTRGGEHVGDLGPGDIFGEVGVLEKERRSATVEATSRVKLIKIEHWELQRMKKKLPEAYEKIAQLAEERAASDASRRPDVEPSWAALRPVLIAFLLLADVFTVAALALARPPGWVPPLIAFSIALVGLIGLEAWALAHRRDDERPPPR